MSIIIRMIARIFQPLVMILSMVGIAAGQFGDCDYEREIFVGKDYYIFSPNYDKGLNYDPGTSCRWTARSDRPMKLSCDPFIVPESPRCTTDVVVIQSGNKPGQRYCGTGTFSVVSEGNTLVVTLFSSTMSRGGQFYCTIEAVSNNTECACGWKNPTKIVGGVDAGVNEYSMMAALIDAKNKIAFCGCTIVNPTQVVTVAHCVVGKMPENIGVLVGDHDLTKGSDTNATKLFRVSRISIHPLYSAAKLDYDIAIIDIVGEIKFNQQVGPACLPFQHEMDSFAGDFVDLLGWGTLEAADRQSPVLQKVKVSVITNRACMNTYLGITNRQLCTYAKGKDSCQFDSGGPVLWQNPTTRRTVLIGMIGYGSLCDDGKPSVNSRIGAYLDFIILNTPQGYRYCQEE